MAQVTLTIKDSLYPLELDAVAAMGGWTETITDANGQSVPNPVTKEQFFKQQIKAWARNQAVEFAARTAAQTATASIETDA